MPDALSRLLARQDTIVRDEDDILEDLVLSNHAISTSVVQMTPDFRAQLGRGYDTDKLHQGPYKGVSQLCSQVAI